MLRTDWRAFGLLCPNWGFRATFCFYIPIYRDLLLGGGVVDAARYSAKFILGAGYSLALVPGGATEALYCNEDKDVVYLKSRGGFIKLALETGASLVPVFSFNECNAYSVIDVPWVNGFKRKFQVRSKKLKNFDIIIIGRMLTRGGGGGGGGRHPPPPTAKASIIALLK